MKRTVTKIIEVFPLDELPEKSQQQAHYRYLENFGADDFQDTLNKFAGIVGLNIRNWSVDDYRCNIKYDINLNEDILKLSGKRLMSYIWNNFKDAFWQGKHYSTKGEWINGKYSYRFRRSKILLISDCPLTGCYTDYDILGPVMSFMKGKYMFWNYEDLIYGCIQNFEKCWLKDYQYQISFEAFREYCADNDFYFTTDGSERVEAKELDAIIQTA